MDPVTAATLATMALQLFFNLSAAAGKTAEQTDADYQTEKVIFIQNNPASLPEV
jgi:hypothetical protein